MSTEIPLRRSVSRGLLWMLVLFVLVNVAATAWWVVRPVILTSAQHAFTSAGERVRSEVEALLLPVELQLRIAARTLESRRWQAPDSEAFLAVFLPILEMTQVTSAVSGDRFGRGVMLLELEPGHWLMRLTDRKRWGSTQRFSAWRDGRVPHTHEEKLEYDPRIRPWYRQALDGEAGRVHWTSPYRFYTTGEAGITASLRLSGEAAQTVVGLDLKLQDLSRLVSRIRPGKGGAVMLLDSDHRVVGMPAMLAGGTSLEASLVLEPVDRLPDRRWARFLARTPCDGRPRFARSFRWMAACNSFDLGGQSFILLTVAPTTDFLPPAASILKNALFILMGMLFMVLAASAWFSSRLSRPIEELQQAAERLLRLQWEQPVRVSSRVREVRGVVRVLERFRRLLRGYRRRIENRELQLHQRIGELEMAEARIERLAFFDSLTDLPNRALSIDRLEQAIAVAEREGFRVAVMFLDLDRFKNINDSLGHEAGDLLLREVAARLSACLRREDTVARLGGDEFVVVLGDASEETTERIARKLLEALQAPYLIQDHGVHLTASVGIAFYPADGSDARTLLRNADAAMYRAKLEGRNRLRYYTGDINRSALERLALEDALHKAVERQEMMLHYQPRVDAGSGRLVGVEALVRWRHPEKGMIPPGHFIPLAEQTGLILPLGQWVLQEACHRAMHWQRRGLGRVAVSVNISQRQFMDQSLVERVRTLLDETGLQPELLELEITETMVATRVEEGVAMLTRLNALGVRLAIDDFGTGYSSLDQLKRFPVHVLKIDKSFVDGIPGDAGDVAITRAIISLARALGLEAVAEGVETLDQLRFLQREGCREMQGYFIARPLPEEELLALLKKKRILEEPRT